MTNDDRYDPFPFLALHTSDGVNQGYPMSRPPVRGGSNVGGEAVCRLEDRHGISVRSALASWASTSLVRLSVGGYVGRLTTFVLTGRETWIHILVYHPLGDFDVVSGSEHGFDSQVRRIDLHGIEIKQQVGFGRLKEASIDYCLIFFFFSYGYARRFKVRWRDGSSLA